MSLNRQKILSSVSVITETYKTNSLEELNKIKLIIAQPKCTNVLTIFEK